ATQGCQSRVDCGGRWKGERFRMGTGTAVLIGVLIGLVVGAGGVFAFLQMSAKNLLAAARTESEQLKENALKEAQNKAKEIELAAKQERLKERAAFEKENQAAFRKLEEHELRLAKREDVV